MTEFDTETLGALRSTQEIAICTHLHPEQRVPIWIVVAGNDAFVRSAYGMRGRWYRDLLASADATLSTNDRELAVRAAPERDAEIVPE